MLSLWPVEENPFSAKITVLKMSNGRAQLKGLQLPVLGGVIMCVCVCVNYIKNNLKPFSFHGQNKWSVKNLHLDEF